MDWLARNLDDLLPLIKKLRAERPNHVWSYDLVSTRTHDGRRMLDLKLIDEFTRVCLLVVAQRRWSSAKA